MKIGDRIKELRKREDMTQVELAEQLNVTDKAVSKWENHVGDPSIDVLIGLSKLFDVSVDYLLTGENREKIMTMSKIEKIAYDDDDKALDDHPLSLDTIDENKKTIVDYIYKYDAIKVFKYLANGNEKQKQIFVKHAKSNNALVDFVKMAFMTESLNLLTKPMMRNHVTPLYEVDISSNAKQENSGWIKYIDVEIIDFILHSDKMTDSAWDFIMGNGKKFYWNKGLSKILEVAVEEKHPKTNELIDFIESMNKEADDLVKNSCNSSNKKHDIIIIRNNLVFNRMSGPSKPIMSYTEITKKTILNAMKHSDYEMVERLNKMSKKSISKREIEMDKVNKNKSLSKRDKLKASVIHDGIVYIDELIALDDYDMYCELIKYPVTHLEKGLQLLENQEYRKILDLAIKFKLKKTIRALQKNDIDQLEDTLETDFIQRKGDVANGDYFRPQKTQKNPVGKEFIFLKDIINHEDERFFEHAAKKDTENLDWALGKLIKERPDEFKLQKILLEAGAKLHKRWVEDDGWGYDFRVDEVDEVGTEILKKQVQILVKEDEQNE